MRKLLAAAVHIAGDTFAIAVTAAGAECCKQGRSVALLGHDGGHNFRRTDCHGASPETCRKRPATLHTYQGSVVLGIASLAKLWCRCRRLRPWVPAVGELQAEGGGCGVGAIGLGAMAARLGCPGASRHANESGITHPGDVWIKEACRLLRPTSPDIGRAMVSSCMNSQEAHRLSAFVSDVVGFL